MTIDVFLPKLGLTQDEGTIVRWIKTEGSSVEKGEALFEVLTDKATIEVEAPASGVLLRILVSEGATAAVGTPIAIIGEHTESSALTEETTARSPRDSIPNDGHIRVSPRARALAAARGVDLHLVRGSGPNGRIVERDVLQAVQAAAVPLPSTATGEAHAVASHMRGIIARRMVASLAGSAQLTLTSEADMAEATRLRKEVGAEFERRGGVRPTYTDLVLRATAVALRDHPRLNARWSENAVSLLSDIHIGVAVALDEGLVVPIVRHADRATLPQISATVRDLSERARAFRLRPDEMEGGTFSITNLGAYDIDVFTPIINPPEAAILGIGRVQPKPVAVGDRVEVRPVMVLSLTFDHRIVDGVPAAQFLRRITQVLEQPYILLLP